MLCYWPWELYWCASPFIHSTRSEIFRELIWPGGMFVSHGFHDWQWHAQRARISSLFHVAALDFSFLEEESNIDGVSFQSAFFWSESEFWIFSPQTLERINCPFYSILSSLVKRVTCKAHRICNSWRVRAVLDIKSPPEILTRYQAAYKHTTGPGAITCQSSRGKGYARGAHRTLLTVSLKVSSMSSLSDYLPARISLSCAFQVHALTLQEFQGPGAGGILGCRRTSDSGW